MIVYGDRERRELPTRWFARLHREVAEVAGEPHDGALARVAIECGMLAQALLDRDFAARGSDERTELSDACAELCFAAGRSFLGGGTRVLEAALSRCEALADDQPLHAREPEGYAFYALYPELYVRAARELKIVGAVQVIGIRSIGTSLAGFVAAALASDRLPYSVRPIGHPFTRELAVGPALAHTLTSKASDAHFVVVDEGPGLSGSSFLAVARWLIEQGVPHHRIALLPSHAGSPGPEASSEARALYDGLTRSVTPFERVFDDRKIEAWFSDLTGPLARPPRDVAGGRWRGLLYPPGAATPPSHVRDERRKYLLEGEQRWLMKFVGLGAESGPIIARLRTLSARGFVPPFVAARHGFILSEWLEATPLPLARVSREALISGVADYLACLAANFPVAEERAGAPPEQLFALLRHNAEELLGEEAREVDRYRELASQLTASFRPTASDNKLDAHEWLVCADGSLKKCDAEAHWAGHDCIGAQDPAWDLAGACVELALDQAELERLLRALRDGAALHCSEAKLRFYELAYAAFRAGHAHYAELALRGWSDGDADRFAREKRRYAEHLSQRLRDRRAL